MKRRFSRPKSPPHLGFVTDECPGNFEFGKFMIPKAQLIDNETWEARKFHLWYMACAKRGVRSFGVFLPKDLFHYDIDCQFVVEFEDMARLFRRQDIDVAQVTLFTM